MTDLAPICGQCRRRHLSLLPCWRGRYAMRVAKHVYEVKGRVCYRGFPGCTRKATTVEHDIPRSHGGTDELVNMLPCCGSCNSFRGNRAVTYKPETPMRPDGAMSPRWHR